MAGDWTTSSRRFVRAHLLEFSILALCIVLAVVLWNMNQLRLEIHQSTAIETASVYIDAYEGLRRVYTTEVVPSALKSGVQATHDYTTKNKGIPLPASFAMEWAKYISSSGKGVRPRLYSDFPFPWNNEGGPKDEFEKSALVALRQNPEKAYFQFETINREWRLRYARADRMQESCVSCHNSHPQSPKRDWKVGDVRGVLEVTLPMNVSNFAGIKIMREKVFLIIILAGLGFGLIYVVLKWVFN